FVKEIGDINEKTALGFLHFEVSRKSALDSVDDLVIQVHPGIAGVDFPLGGLGFTSISRRSRTAGASRAGLCKMIVGTALSGICSLGWQRQRCEQQQHHAQSTADTTM